LEEEIVELEKMFDDYSGDHFHIVRIQNPLLLCRQTGKQTNLCLLKRALYKHQPEVTQLMSTITLATYHPTINQSSIKQTTGSNPVDGLEHQSMPTIQDNFIELLEINQDVVGWLHIEGTVIDYPVLQAEDNDFYLRRDWQKNDNIAGSIFMDYRNDILSIQPGSNTIIYGHRMNDGSMFGELIKYESRWNFENHRIIHLDTLYETYEWEIFSAYITDTSFDYIRTEFVTGCKNRENKKLFNFWTSVNRLDSQNRENYAA
jgi:SrtB family sortase